MDASRFLDPKEFLYGYISQVTPGVVSNIMTGGQENLLPGVLTKDDQKNRLSDYFDVITHEGDALRGILGPILAP